jgi:hypothetical protein
VRLAVCSLDSVSEAAYPRGFMKKFQITHYTIRTRSLSLNWNTDAKPPAKLIAEANDFHAESRLLDILRDAGYQAEYDLDAERRPTALRIRIPPGKSASGYPDDQESIILSPHTAGRRNAILKVSSELLKPVRKVKKS